MFFRPPNETASTPVGFDPARASVAAEGAEVPEPAATPEPGATPQGN
jgi:hypothetical protein